MFLRTLTRPATRVSFRTVPTATFARGISFANQSNSNALTAHRAGASRVARESALTTGATLSRFGSALEQFGGVLSIPGLSAIQRRFKSRGNTYQPSTLKRKRKFGFLARLKSRLGRKILVRRKEKGRWYLTH